MKKRYLIRVYMCLQRRAVIVCTSSGSFAGQPAGACLDETIQEGSEVGLLHCEVGRFGCCSLVKSPDGDSHWLCRELCPLFPAGRWPRRTTDS
eukprot:2454451-Amphidinium_carterae.1